MRRPRTSCSRSRPRRQHRLAQPCRIPQHPTAYRCAKGARISRSIASRATSRHHSSFGVCLVCLVCLVLSVCVYRTLRLCRYEYSSDSLLPGRSYSRQISRTACQNTRDCSIDSRARYRIYLSIYRVSVYFFLAFPLCRDASSF